MRFCPARTSFSIIAGTSLGITETVPLGRDGERDDRYPHGALNQSLCWSQPGTPYTLLATVVPLSGTTVPSGALVFVIGSNQATSRPDNRRICRVYRHSSRDAGVAEILRELSGW